MLGTIIGIVNRYSGYIDKILHIDAFLKYLYFNDFYHYADFHIYEEVMKIYSYYFNLIM